MTQQQRKASQLEFLIHATLSSNTWKKDRYDKELKNFTEGFAI
jgi:hypothetical protein